MAERRRSVRPPSNPPPDYTPPQLGTPSPEVTNRITENHAAREVTLTAVTGKRWWAWGRQQLGGKIQYTYKYQTNEVWLVIELCKGECDSLVKCLIGGVPWPATANTISSAGQLNLWWYPGTPGGTLDTHLAAVDPTWNETFPGTSYAVVQLLNLDRYWPERPNIVFEMLTYKPIDPRTDARAYSENPFVQWWDWLLDAEGKNMPLARLLKQTFKDAADLADQTVGSRKRFEAHPLLTDATDVDDVIKMFRLMTNSWFLEENGVWKVVPDQPASSAATYGDSNLSSSVIPVGRGGDDLERPNRVIVEITDTANGWKLKPIPVETAAVTAGTEQALPVTFRMPWIHNEGLGASIAKYILNGYVFDRTLFVRWNETTSDRTLGDVVTQNVVSRGLAFVGRFLSRRKTFEKSVYDVILYEYNAARFSDDVATSTPKTPSTLPDPGDVPPDVTLGTVTITEELYRPQQGFPLPRGVIEITNPNFYFLDAVELWSSINGGPYVFFKDFPGGSNQVVKLNFDAVNEVGVPYSFKFITRSRFGPKSAGVIKTPATTFGGKTTPPADVPFLYASAIADQIKLVWQSSGDPDVTSYEVRRGPVGTTWDQAVRVGTQKAFEMFDKPPMGTWLYLVKAIDYAKNFSTNATTCQIVTSFSGPQAASSVAFDQAWSSNWATLGMVFGDTLVNNAADPLTAWVWEGVSVKQTATAFLCRTLSPAAIDAEIAAGGYASVAAWENNLDLPRRKNAPIWAPLNLINGMAAARFYSDHAIASDANGWRNADWRLQIPAVRAGIDGPDVVCNALPGFKETEFHPNGDGISYLSEYGFGSDGSGHISSPMHSLQGGVSMHPSILSTTNSPYAQVVMSGPVAAFYRYSFQQQEVLIAIGDVTTDGSGLAQLVFPVAMPTGQVPSLDYNIINGSNAVLVVHSVSNTQMTVKALTPSTGAVLSGVQIRMKAVDRGLGGSTVNYLF
jgi:hypothetical protein